MYIMHALCETSCPLRTVHYESSGDQYAGTVNVILSQLSWCPKVGLFDNILRIFLRTIVRDRSTSLKKETHGNPLLSQESYL